MGRAQDRFGDGLNVAGMNRLGKRSHRGIKRDFHHRDYLGRKRRVGKILHDGRDRKGRLPTHLGNGMQSAAALEFDVSYPLDTDCIIFPTENRSGTVNKIAARRSGGLTSEGGVLVEITV